MNLDPLDAFGDAAIWRAIKLAHLEPLISSLSGKLDYQLSEGGENFR